LAEYRLDQLAEHFTPARVRARRERSLWKFAEVLPVDRPENAVSMGEGMTPLVGVRGRGPLAEFRRLFVKDESFNPTGSFKARGMSAAITRAKALGTRTVVLPSAGNAGGAAASYAARAGMDCFVFMPDDTPTSNVVEANLAGACVVLVKGLINDCGKLVRQAVERFGWFDLSTLKEPFRVEGKKTMGYELAFDFAEPGDNGRLALPDVIFYPTGGGTGLIGMWKAFDELEKIGFIGSKRPRMVAVQASGCAPMVRAYEQGVEHAARWEDAHTIASGIRVPQAIGDFLILRAVRESKGFAIAVDDEKISSALNEVAREEGLLLCPEGAATYAAYKDSLADGRVTKNDRVMLFNCATGLKYPLPPVNRTLDRHQPIDFGQF
jgi:threonine synthase